MYIYFLLKQNWHLFSRTAIKAVISQEEDSNPDVLHMMQVLLVTSSIHAALCKFDFEPSDPSFLYVEHRSRAEP